MDTAKGKTSFSYEKVVEQAKGDLYTNLRYFYTKPVCVRGPLLEFPGKVTVLPWAGRRLV